jgi:hypothetical protein
MRQAPAVRMACATGLGWRVVQVLLAGLAAVALMAWLLPAYGLTGPAWLAATCVAALAAALMSRLSHSRAAVLEWDGARWALHVEGAADALELPAPDVMFDWGPRLLLRACSAKAGVHWLTISGAQVPAQLLALRWALYSRRAGADPNSAAQKQAP